MAKARIFASRDLSSVLSDLLKPLSGNTSSFLSRIKSDWHLIAGAEAARRSRPVKVTRPQRKKDEAILHLEVDEGFILEMQYMEQLLIEKIAAYFGYRAVSGIRCKQVEVAMGKENTIHTRVLTDQEKSEVAEATGGIGDERLKKALENLGAAVIAKR